MGFLTRSKAASSGVTQSQTSPTRTGDKKSASAAPSVPVQNPGFPEGDLGYIGVELFRACGLSAVTFSRLPIRDHFAAISRVVPVFRQSTANPVGAGNFRGRESTGAWIAWDSPAGSVISTHFFPDSDTMFVTQEIIDKVATAEEGIEWGIAVAGSIPAPVASILESGKPVPLWELPGMGGLRPVATSGVKPPELLRQRLTGSGWEELSETLFKAVITTGGDRTQVVLFGTWNAFNFACMSPVAHAESGRLPTPLRAIKLDRYSFDIVGDLVMLCQPMPAGPPSPTLEEINQTAIELASFADRIEADLSTDDEF